MNTSMKSAPATTAATHRRPFDATGGPLQRARARPHTRRWEVASASTTAPTASASPAVVAAAADVPEASTAVVPKKAVEGARPSLPEQHDHSFFYFDFENPEEVVEVQAHKCKTSLRGKVVPKLMLQVPRSSALTATTSDKVAESHVRRADALVEQLTEQVHHTREQVAALEEARAQYHDSRNTAKRVASELPLQHAMLEDKEAQLLVAGTLLKASTYEREKLRQRGAQLRKAVDTMRSQVEELRAKRAEARGETADRFQTREALIHAAATLSVATAAAEEKMASLEEGEEDTEEEGQVNASVRQQQLQQWRQAAAEEEGSQALMEAEVVIEAAKREAAAADAVMTYEQAGDEEEDLVDTAAAGKIQGSGLEPRAVRTCDNIEGEDRGVEADSAATAAAAATGAITMTVEDDDDDDEVAYAAPAPATTTTPGRTHTPAAVLTVDNVEEPNQGNKELAEDAAAPTMAMTMEEEEEEEVDEEAFIARAKARAAAALHPRSLQKCKEAVPDGGAAAAGGQLQTQVPVHGQCQHPPLPLANDSSTFAEPIAPAPGTGLEDNATTAAAEAEAAAAEAAEQERERQAREDTRAMMAAAERRAKEDMAAAAAAAVTAAEKQEGDAAAAKCGAQGEAAAAAAREHEKQQRRREREARPWYVRAGMAHTQRAEAGKKARGDDEKGGDDEVPKEEEAHQGNSWLSMLGLGRRPATHETLR